MLSDTMRSHSSTCSVWQLGQERDCISDPSKAQQPAGSLHRAQYNTKLPACHAIFMHR